MSSPPPSPRFRATRIGVLRRLWAVIAVGAVLLSTAGAMAREPGPVRGPSTSAERSRARSAIRSDNSAALSIAGADSGRNGGDEHLFRVRSADWLESIDGTAGADASFADDAQTVILLSGESTVLQGSSQRRNTNPAEQVAPTGFHATGNDPLSRLTLSDSTSQFDPGQTLKEWAEGAGLMVAFGVVALWLIRQWLTRRDLPGRPTVNLRTIETLSLPQRCRVHLVEVDRRQVLVAADSTGIKSVTVLPDRFATLLEHTDDQSEPNVSQFSEPPDAERGVVWSGRNESRLT
jgi:flagellar biogenesis protein FliO